MGVLIGRLSDDREYILLNIPTPTLEVGQLYEYVLQQRGPRQHANVCTCMLSQAGASAIAVHQGSGKKPLQKGRAAAAPEAEVRIKVEWVVEHARQVSTLLPGGKDSTA